MKLTFKQIKKENKTDCEIFKSLMLDYAKELDEHQNRNTQPDVLLKWTESIIELQKEQGRYLELCLDDDEIIGFFYGKIDKPNHKGYIRIGWGYVMEFYVKPDYRRQGYGTEMYKRLEGLFYQDGASDIYLTSDPVTGKPFWEASGFVNTGEISLENNQALYEKS